MAPQPRRHRTPKARVGSEPVYVEYPDMPLASRITLVVAERFRLAGFESVQALAPGYKSPTVIRGAHTDFRPHITAKTKNGRPVFIDACDPNEKEETLAAKWQLFSSAAEVTGGQFHIAVPALVKKVTGTMFVKAKAKRFGVTEGIHKIWEI